MRKTLLCLLLALVLLPTAPVQANTPTTLNWYEVFVYSYADADGDGIGDLRGLIGKLDFIADLGFDGLWLMPIMPSPSYHKYDVRDYYEIDPQYGTLDDMRGLVAACQARGIRLIIDLVLNHTSTRHPWFIAATDAIKAGRLDEPFIDYYHFSKEPGGKAARVFGTDWYYEEQFQGGGMPDLNLDNPALRADIRDIIAFWLIDIGVDGFRLDAVTSYYTGQDERNIAFLRFLKETAEEIKPGSFLVGEAWTNLTTIAHYYDSGIDSFFLFPAAQAEGYVAASLRARSPAATFAKYLLRVQEAIPSGLLTPFLSNHDTGRTVGLVQGRQASERVKFAHGLLSLIGGASFTYYGEEIGMVGSGADPNKRLGMLWAMDEPTTRPPPGVTSTEYPYPGVAEQLADPLSILNYIKQLNHLRLTWPEVAAGPAQVLQETADTLLLKRMQGEDAVYIAVNFSAKEARELYIPARLRLLNSLLVGEEEASLVAGGTGTLLTLPPYSILILKEDTQ